MRPPWFGLLCVTISLFCSSSSFLFVSISGLCTHSRSPPKYRRLGIRQGGGACKWVSLLPGITIINHSVSSASSSSCLLPWCGTVQARRLAGWLARWAWPLLGLGEACWSRTASTLLCRPVGFQGKCSSRTHPPKSKNVGREEPSFSSGGGFMAGACMRADGGL
ncbi:hypothetical protein F5883DRAFT_134265 [Diaporthe sp. PMI_573]|nr:hypothetical protein F5883DRAFT_134265 [Diaporthaceae sp. PMI_573]